MAVDETRCSCRKWAVDVNCPKHGIGSKRFIANLAGLAVAFSVAVVAIFTAPAGSASKPVPLVICDVFGPYCNQALTVSWCESRWHPNARNGQYRGIFQMGSWERRTFGHGPDAFSQARAAYRYFVRTGRTWRPWSCKP